MEERREEGEEEVMEAASQNSLAEHIAKMEIRFLPHNISKKEKTKERQLFIFQNKYRCCYITVDHAMPAP
jgi:hypothetical protein